MNRGSTWNIWDFHLHTPNSILNNQFGDPADESTWQQYIDSIEAKVSDTGIVAIGITDYFTIEGYKRILDFQQKGRLENLLIFPNIEFRIDTIVQKRRLNAHVIFSPEVRIQNIEEHFLHDLSFIHENDPFDPSQTRKLRLTNLIEFGQALQEQHAPFKDRAALEIGCMNAKVSLNEIKERLQDSRFAGRHLLVLADEDLGLMNWDGQDHATRKQLLQSSHAVFSSNPKTREFCLGRSHDSEEDFIAEFRSLKPCIWGCDSHGFSERFLEPDQQRYCWIKGKVSWDGLKQILYEPEDRVRIQAHSPEHPKSFHTLDSIQVSGTQVNNALRIEGTDIELNPNLVVIIGGRGSGKTALLDLIAACFPEGRKLSAIESSFYHRLYAVDGKRKNLAHPVPITLQFRSGERYFSNIGEDERFFEQADVLYVTQSHIDDYTANPSKLYKHIVDLVFDQKLESRRIYSQIEELASDLQQQVESLNLQIAQLRQQVDNELEKERIERLQKQGEITDYQNRLGEQEAQREGSSEATIELTDRLRLLRLTQDALVDTRKRLQEISRKIDNFCQEYIVDVSAINAQLAGLKALPEASDILQLPDGTALLKDISETITKDLEALQQAHPSITNQLSSVENELGQLQGIDRTIAEIRRSKDAIEKEIGVITARIEALEEKNRLIYELGNKRIEATAELLEKLVEQRLHLQAAINEFETAQDDLLSGLTFKAIVDTSIQDKYVSRIADKIDGRVHSTDSVKNELALVIERADQKLNALTTEDLGTNEGTTLSIVQELCEWAKDIRLKSSVSEAEFYTALLSPFCRIGLRIEFNGRQLEALSMGERAVVLLKILLGLDDKPLFIDQPEEHLDNRYIYNELTPAFRKAKTKRQIIIATHNANLVVNTDAEQIIIAEHSNGVISYRAGTLEDPQLRKDITTILEGGDQAFKKREEKYGYRF